METAQISRINNENATMQHTSNTITLKMKKHVREVFGHFRHKPGKISYSRLSENGSMPMRNFENVKEQSYEEPIDLSCEKRKTEPLSTKNIKIEPGSPVCNSATIALAPNNLKRRGRKRKIEQPIVDMPLPEVEINLLKNLDTPYYVQDNKKVEVLKAAKSLFSKRTRTLYHWIYPDAPKTQLKAAVASSWEALGVQEKEFYISQVLGRFGFPQSNLMVNPQLGGLTGTLPLVPAVVSMSNHNGIEETSSAVSTILQEDIKSTPDEIGNSGSMLTYPQYTKLMSRKFRKKNKHKKCINENNNILKEIRDDVADEFQDDPELSREFQQFKWNLHLNENKI